MTTSQPSPPRPSLFRAYRRFVEASYIQALPLQSMTFSIFRNHTPILPIPIQTDPTRGHLIPGEVEQNRVICMICACLVPPLHNFLNLSVKWLKVTRGSCQALCISLFPICWLRNAGPFFFLFLSFFFCFFPRLCFQKYLLLLRHLFYLMMQGSSG